MIVNLKPVIHFVLNPGKHVTTCTHLYPMCHKSWVTSHGSHVLGHVSWVTCPGSHVLCHISSVTCPSSHSFSAHTVLLHSPNVFFLLSATVAQMISHHSSSTQAMKHSSASMSSRDTTEHPQTHADKTSLPSLP